MEIQRSGRFSYLYTSIAREPKGRDGDGTTGGPRVLHNESRLNAAASFLLKWTRLA
jgi:hypothetical protein